MKQYINFLNKLNFYRNSKLVYFTIKHHKFMESTFSLYLRFNIIASLQYKNDCIYIYPGRDLRIKLINKYTKRNPFFVRIRNLYTIDRINFSCIIMCTNGFITHKEAIEQKKGGILFSYIILI